MVKQVSVFLENKEGRFQEVLKLLAENNLDIRTFTIAETSDYGVLRLIMADTKKTIEVLKENMFRVNETEVMVLEIPDTIGATYELVSLLSEHNINIEYAYNCTSKSPNTALCAIRVNNDKTESVKEIISKHEKIKLMEP